MIEHAVVIAGGGPTGLMLAGELALAGVDVAVVERRPDQELAGSRAGGLHARTIELFDQRGIADRFLSEGQPAQVAVFAGVVMDISAFPTRHPYGLGLWQNHIERILAGWVAELGVTIHYDREVSGFAQDETGVDVALSCGDPLRAQYLVGCDGGRSLVRKAAGIEFPGCDPTTSSLIAEVELSEQPELGVHHNAFGIHSFGRAEYEIRDGEVVFKDVGPMRVMVTEQRCRCRGRAHPGRPQRRAGRRLRDRLRGAQSHLDLPVPRHGPAGRGVPGRAGVLLAGDAAHVHPPDGGQGLQTGVQDAVNLGWKLAQVVRRTSPESLLDSYHSERHPVAAEVLRNTMASGVLRRPDERSKAVRAVLVELLGMDEPRRRFAAMMSGLDIHYDAEFTGRWELPVLGTVAAPSAVLIRPDGYVAWVGDGTDRGLQDALIRWCGPAAR